MESIYNISNFCPVLGTYITLEFKQLCTYIKVPIFKVSLFRQNAYEFNFIKNAAKIGNTSIVRSYVKTHMLRPAHYEELLDQAIYSHDIELLKFLIIDQGIIPNEAIQKVAQNIGSQEVINLIAEVLQNNYVSSVNYATSCG